MASMNDRYARQRVLPEIGSEGQEKLLHAAVVVIGCGALGSVQGQLLARAGVGSGSAQVAARGDHDSTTIVPRSPTESVVPGQGVGGVAVAVAVGREKRGNRREQKGEQGPARN